MLPALHRPGSGLSFDPLYSSWVVQILCHGADLWTDDSCLLPETGRITSFDPMKFIVVLARQYYGCPKTPGQRGG